MFDHLVAQVRQGNRRAIARLITRVENNDSAAQAAVTALYPDTGRAHIVGVTGSPGSGKSTVVNELAKRLRRRGLSVGIIAVDPSSPFSGGALLGDRVRMRDLAGDKGIFIRSMASRGSLGGLSRTTSAVAKVLDAAGFDTILIETVGAGQAEVDIASAAHTTLVIEAPGMGDDIQMIKAGILEIADILVVNKVDRAGAASTVKALKMMLQLGASQQLTVNSQQLTVNSQQLTVNSQQSTVNSQQSTTDGLLANSQTPLPAWQVPVLESVATDGQGIEETVDAILAHKDYLQVSGGWLVREMARSRQEVNQLLQAHFMDHLQEVVPPQQREILIAAVAAREIDPYSAVAQLFSRVVW